jgi:hypothetical protein
MEILSRAIMRRLKSFTPSRPRVTPRSVAIDAWPSQSTQPSQLEAHTPDLRTMDTTSSSPASLPGRAFRRYSSKVGAVCGSSARTDLCGGRPAMTVPTATAVTPKR